MINPRMLLKTILLNLNFLSPSIFNPVIKVIKGIKNAASPNHSLINLCEICAPNPPI